MYIDEPISQIGKLRLREVRELIQFLQSMSNQAGHPTWSPILYPTFFSLFCICICSLVSLWSLPQPWSRGGAQEEGEKEVNESQRQIQIIKIVRGVALSLGQRKPSSSSL